MYSFFKGFKLSKHADGFGRSGSQFVWFEYGVGADFLKCDGVTMLCWRGQHNLHGTVKSAPTEEHTVLGTFIQVADYLVKKIALYLKQKEEGNSQHVVADVAFNYNKIK